MVLRYLCTIDRDFNGAAELRHVDVLRKIEVTQLRLRKWTSFDLRGAYALPFVRLCGSLCAALESASLCVSSKERNVSLILDTHTHTSVELCIFVASAAL